MKLSNRSYAVERAFKPFLIPFKVAEQMNTADWEYTVKDAEMIIRSNESIKRTKPSIKRQLKNLNIYQHNPKITSFEDKILSTRELFKGNHKEVTQEQVVAAKNLLTRKKVNYKADESLVHERYNLEEVRRSRKWK